MSYLFKFCLSYILNCDKEILNDSDFDYDVYYKEIDEIVYTENPMKRK